MATTPPLETLVSNVIGKVSLFFEDVCENEEQSKKNWQRWENEVFVCVM